MTLMRRPFTILDVDLIGVVALLVVGAVAWLGVIEPIWNHRAGIQDLSAAAAMADAAIQRSAEKLRITEDEVRRMRAAIEDKQRDAPTPTVLPMFLQRITTVAEACALQVMQVLPVAPSSQSGGSGTDVQVTARGTLIGLARFADRMRREEPHCSFVEYAVTGIGKDPNATEYSVSWTLRLNVMPEDPALARN